MIRNLLFLITILLITSCIQVEDQRLSAYIDIDSLVSAQVVELYAAKATLHKSGIVAGGESESTDVPDSLRWVRELGIFRQANLNKPRLAELYTTSRVAADGGETVTLHNTTAPKDTRVQWLKVTRGEYLKSIEAEITDSNPVYGSKMLLKMEFSESSSGLLKAYEITGGERLKVKDTVSYDLRARISR